MRIIKYYDRIHRQFVDLEVTDEVAKFLMRNDKWLRRQQIKYNYYFEPKLNQINDVSEHLDEFSMWLEKRLATLSDKNFGKYNNLNEEWFVSYKEIFEKLGWKYGRERK